MVANRGHEKLQCSIQDIGSRWWVRTAHRSYRKLQYCARSTDEGHHGKHRVQHHDHHIGGFPNLSLLLGRRLQCSIQDIGSRWLVRTAHRSCRKLQYCARSTDEGHHGKHRVQHHDHNIGGFPNLSLLLGRRLQHSILNIGSRCLAHTVHRSYRKLQYCARSIDEGHHGKHRVQHDDHNIGDFPQLAAYSQAKVGWNGCKAVLES